MYGNFSNDALDQYQVILQSFNEKAPDGEEDAYDFTRCLRPDGSAYGTRGICQTPNKVAPKQDVSEMNKKDFLAGGGLTAVQKGASSTQVVNRGRDARARAFEAGGGMTSMSKSGMTRDQVVERGAKNRADAYKAGGGSKSGKSANETIKQGAKNRAEAYKAGGGDAASRQGMNKSDVIKKGADNLKAAYEAGGGDAAKEKLGNTKTVIERGKKALEGAVKAGGGDKRKGQDILSDPMGYTKRSTLEAGGGEAMVKKISQALTEAYRRGLTDKEIEKVRSRVAGKGVDNLNRYFNAGGGNKAVSGGKTVDEVINQGQKLIEGAKQKKQQELSQSVRNRLEKGSQIS